MGKYLFTTHLKDTDVSNNVYDVCSLDWGKLGSIENIVNADNVIKNIRK